MYRLLSVRNSGRKGGCLSIGFQEVLWAVGAFGFWFRRFAWERGEACGARSQRTFAVRARWKRAPRWWGGQFLGWNFGVDVGYDEDGIVARRGRA